MTGLRGKELAAAVVAVVEQHPEAHDQNDVTCGTTACLAGWTIAKHHRYKPGDTLPFWWKILDYSSFPSLEAMKLLEVSADLKDEFLDRVFCEMNRDKAISAFIELTGLADVEPLPAPQHAEAV